MIDWKTVERALGIKILHAPPGQGSSHLQHPVCPPGLNTIVSLDDGPDPSDVMLSTCGHDMRNYLSKDEGIARLSNPCSSNIVAVWSGTPKAVLLALVAMEQEQQLLSSLERFVEEAP